MRYSKNNEKFRKKMVCFFLAGAVAFAGGNWEWRFPMILTGNMKSYAAEVETDTAMKEIGIDIVRLVNEERARFGLPELIWDSEIAEAASVRAEEQKSAFSHIRPGGERFFTVFQQAEIKATIVGENLARGKRGTASTIMNAWMSSEGHRRNILNERFSRIGIGYAENGTDIYWCQLFAD